jgi:hypothetical protein
MWIPCRIYDQWIRGDDLYHIIEVAGPEEIANALGIKSNKALPGIIDALQAGADWRMRWPSGREVISLWGFDYQRAGYGHRAYVRLEVHSPLLPEETRNLSRNTRQERMARRLVPILRTTPPLPGRSNEHAAILRTHFDLLAHFVRRAEDYVDRGAFITPELLAQWTRDAGLPTGGKMNERYLLGAWRSGTDNEPSLIIETERGHYQLSEHHAEADRSIRALADKIRGGRAWNKRRKKGRKRQ